MSTAARSPWASHRRQRGADAGDAGQRHELHRARIGIDALCIGGGEAVAMAVELC